MDRRALIVGSVMVLAAPRSAEGPMQTSIEERFFSVGWQLERSGDRDVAIVGLQTGTRTQFDGPDFKSKAVTAPA